MSAVSPFFLAMGHTYTTAIGFVVSLSAAKKKFLCSVATLFFVAEGNQPDLAKHSPGEGRSLRPGSVSAPLGVYSQSRMKWASEI